MWSEHCSYKSSKPLLRTLPTAGEGVVAGPGRERGRHLDRRRPRGRVQDRIAQPPERRRAVPGRGDRRRWDPARHLHDGRPTDRGPRCAALRRPGRRADAPPGRRRRARRRRLRQLRRRPDGRRRARLRPELPGQPAGQRDGHRPARGAAPDAAPRRRARATSSSSTARRPGATGSAARRSWPARPSPTTTRPSGRRVQVGDPFAEKLLIEASLELIERGLVEGLQDLGAGGITCATSETADRAGTGILVDLDAIPRREPGSSRSR